MKKMSFLKYTASILGVCLATTLSSCSCDDDYKPGSPTTEGAVCAYFDKDNTSAFVLTPEDESIQLIISRSDTTLAATVPIKVVSEDTTAIKVPESVSFAAGEKTQTLTIETKGLTTKKQYNFKLAIDESAANHYIEQEGTTIFQGSVIVSQWTKLKEDILFYYNQHSELPSTNSDLYQLEGVNQFYLTNFMGSGVSLYFSISGTDINLNDPSTWTGEIIPVEGKGAAIYDQNTYKLNYVWLGLDDNGEDIFNWNVDGLDIEYFDWYGGYNYSTYSWIDYSQNYIYLNGYISSTKLTGYVTVYGIWE